MDGINMWPSPCHAGCKKGKGTHYTDCACVREVSRKQNSSRVPFWFDDKETKDIVDNITSAPGEVSDVVSFPCDRNASCAINNVLFLVLSVIIVVIGMVSIQGGPKLLFYQRMVDPRYL